MASLDFNSKTRKARFFFRFDRQQYNKTLTMESEKQADRLKALIEETIEDLERGKRQIPEGADIAAFILSGGKVVSKPRAVSDPFQPESKWSISQLAVGLRCWLNLSILESLGWEAERASGMD